ncbi:hypothetical protein D9O50_01870 [Oxalobacteraceae bacterium CAVE-383]|nr:hypothetical protein D9O50_01870 [Oxalobacteraceae bacterium CAVE-383]
MIVIEKSRSTGIHSPPQYNAEDANTVALIVLLLAVKAEKPEEAAAFPRRPSISAAGGADEVDGKATRTISRFVDHLAGVFSDKDDVRRSEFAEELTGLIGKEGADRLMASFPSHYANAPDVQKELLLIEVRKINAARLHIDGLRDKDLHSIPNDPIAHDCQSPLKDAVEWILSESNSKQHNNAAEFLQVISNYVNGAQSLTERHAIDELHAKLVPKMNMDSRHIHPGAPTLSNVSGEKLFNRHLQKLRAKQVNPDDLAEHLFAGIVGYHPYADGNGRTGRAVYAILKLRAGAFQRLSEMREYALSGLHTQDTPLKEFAPAAQRH